MERRTFGLVLGFAGCILWFMPWVAWEQEFFGRVMPVHQAGNHIGGLAYILFAAAAVSGIAAWMRQYQVQFISGLVALGISALYAWHAGEQIAWGLVGLLAVALLTLLVAWQGMENPDKVPASI